MHTSHFLILTVLGTLFLPMTLSLPHSTHMHPHHNDPHTTTTTIASYHQKRDLLGNLFPPINSQPSAVPAAGGAPAPAVSSVPVVSGTSPAPEATMTGDDSGGSAAGANAPSSGSVTTGSGSAAPPSSTSTTNTPTTPKKKGSASSGGSPGDSITPGDSTYVNAADNTLSGAGSDKPHHANSSNPGNANSSSNSHSTDSSQASTTALSPGIIVLMVIMGVAVLSAVSFSCYRIRQSRQRRRRGHESWDEDILKNHAGSVGYTEGGGYGMYVGGSSAGTASKEKPDLWRKNLDMFHRE